ncbi:tyrosine-type recombinase/integrase [Bradyrhizobium icense]|uniref:tyrosine-type recombinase/integrase n=1 Tax=Bradyrhizobium icense TaxID=1274631 RepID=UPI0009F52DB3|nr:site-specific integrase [Bradyrhizobium icense]
MEQLTHTSEASVTVAGKRKGNVKVALNSNQVKSLQAGVHADAGGLYLVVRKSGDRVWAFRFTDLEGKRAQMEFAKAGDRDSPSGDALTLSSAREKARDYKVALKREGIDPRVKKRATGQGSKTFKEFAEEQYPVWCQGLSEEELKQWQRSIRDVPSLHDKKLQEITTEHVLEALKAIWTLKPVTASRTRQRIERLMDAAKALRLRTGENPAAWRGNLKHLLPSPRKLNRKKGHRSAPYTKMPQMMTGLRYDAGNAARCTEVGILTVSRSQEIRLMEWTELDFEARTWMVPAEKMKIKGELEPKPHLVPLSDQAIEIIQSMPRTDKYVFPSDHAEQHQPFRANALVGAIERTAVKSTMHGCRTSFRNWGADNKEHNFRREVLEFCLSHRVGDEAELSYWDSEMIQRRRDALQAWADFIKPRKNTSGEQPPESKRQRLKLVA